MKLCVVSVEMVNENNVKQIKNITTNIVKVEKVIDGILILEKEINFSFYKGRRISFENINNIECFSPYFYNSIYVYKNTECSKKQIENLIDFIIDDWSFENENM